MFLRAAQFALVGGLVGSVLSGVLALPGGEVPFLAGGGLLAAMALVLTWIMPETTFRPAARAPRLGGIARDAWAGFAGQVRKTHGAMVAVPGLVLLLGFVFFVGMWSESFDRLWGAYLLKDTSFPHAFGLDVVIWFSILAVARTLLSLGSTEWAKRRTSKLGPGSVALGPAAALLAVAALWPPGGCGSGVLRTRPRGSATASHWAQVGGVDGGQAAGPWLCCFEL